MNILPFNVDDLINARSVESVRIEYKSACSEVTLPSIQKSIAAFANDLSNLNGGFIVIGIEAPEGVPVLPPIGIPPQAIEKIQQEIRVACKKIDPEYQPLIFPTMYMNTMIMILCVPAGDNRPYSAPDNRKPGERCYYVRQGAETVKATDETLRQLLEQTARIPFDDRRNSDATVLDLSPILVKRFLQEVNSDIINTKPPPADIDIYKALRIVATWNETLLPKNVGLLFFNERPSRFFVGAAFEIVQFGDDAGGNLIEEKRFEGPIDTVITSVLDDLNNLTAIQLRKLPYQPTVERTVAYPYEALEEAITNAVYHRGYENSTEPNKIYLYPDRMEIISYPGPVPGLKHEYLLSTGPIPQFPARNRRIGEFLKELKLAEMRGTGIPKIRRTMAQNGSPAPSFDFDEARSYFRATLPAHPRYVLVHALRESTYLWSIGERRSAVDKLLAVFQQQHGSGAIASQLIEYLHEVGDKTQAQDVFSQFQECTVKSEAELPYLRYVKILISNDEDEKAKQVIESMSENDYWGAPLDVAISFKRLKLYERAHTIFSRIYSSYESNVDYLHNFAQTKIAISNELAHKRNTQWSTINRLRRETIELLRRAIGLVHERDYVEAAWCWFDLARTMSWLRFSKSQIQEAFEKAIDLLPYEKVFREAYDRWRSKTPP